MKNELVSIILPAYNEKLEWFKKSVDSILNQTYSNIELILIIDNPNNYDIILYSQEIQLKDNRIRLHINPENMGLVYCLNYGIKHSRGNIIARMDADDISDLNRIKKQIDFLNSHPDCVLLGTQLILIDEEDKLIEKSIKLPTQHSLIRKALKYNNVICHPSIIFKKEFVLNIGAYQDIQYAEDYDLITRVILNGGKIYNVDEKLIYYRIRNTGITQSNKVAQIHSQQLVKDRYRQGQKDCFYEKYINEENLTYKQKYRYYKDQLFYKLLINKTL